MIENQKAVLAAKKESVKSNIAATSGNNAEVMLRIEGQQYKVGVSYRVNAAQLACAAQFTQEVESIDKDGVKKTETKVTHYVVQPTDKGNIALARLFSRFTIPTSDYLGSLGKDLAQASSTLEYASILATLAAEKDVLLTIKNIRKDKTGFTNSNGVEVENTQLCCSYEYAPDEIVVSSAETAPSETAQS